MKQLSTERRLNKAIIKCLKKENNLDHKFLIAGDKAYSKRDLIRAIENNDPIAEDLIGNLVALTIDLLEHNKIKQ